MTTSMVPHLPAGAYPCPLLNRAWLELARAGSWIYLVAVLAISAAAIGAVA